MSEYAFWAAAGYAASAVIVLIGAVGVVGVVIQLTLFVKRGQR